MSERQLVIPYNLQTHSHAHIHAHTTIYIVNTFGGKPMEGRGREGGMEG